MGLCEYLLFVLDYCCCSLNRNNRGIDEGNDLPKLLLERLFDDICAVPILVTKDRQVDGLPALYCCVITLLVKK